MVLLREILGDTLRSKRLAQRRTLREVSAAAKVSLGYLSEVERGQKEASSELLASICEALGMELSDLMRDVGTELAHAEVRFKSGAAASRRALRAAPPAGADTAKKDK
ncbi:MAG: helix-turn-helix transcriptional regulator [Corynebacteriales bacterium]|nr:helix-turn-helix transcriptional regulator [Mycobacteriales bacterium]